MNDVIVEIRNVITSLIGITLAYIAPIKDMVFVMFLLFVLNMVMWLVAGIVVNNEKFKFKKFFHCLLEIFFLDVLSLFFLGGAGGWS